MPGHPVFARLWGRCVAPLVRRELDGPRRRALAGLSGTVVEVGAGEGSNLPLYPVGVGRVVAVEPEPSLRRLLRRRAEVLSDPPHVDVRAGSAEHLPVDDTSADAVVFCLVLCSVADVGAALAEARRVLRPGGEVRLLEHVLDPEPGRRRERQHRADRGLRPRLTGGCHVARDPLTSLAAAGFGVTALERFSVPAGSRSVSAPAVVARARPRTGPLASTPGATVP